MTTRALFIGGRFDGLQMDVPLPLQDVIHVDSGTRHRLKWIERYVLAGEPGPEQPVYVQVPA